jgi:hypothetical protein
MNNATTFDEYRKAMGIDVPESPYNASDVLDLCRLAYEAGWLVAHLPDPTTDERGTIQ